jgi:putative flippase GtrA
MKVIKINSTFFRFLIVGVINTIVGSGVMFLLYNVAGAGYWLSSAANYVVGSICSFFLNKYFTFGVKTWSVRQIAGFVLTIAVSYVLAYGIAKPLVNAALSAYSARLRDNCAMFAGMCLFTVLNYLGQRFIAFRRNHE